MCGGSAFMGLPETSIYGKLGKCAELKSQAMLAESQKPSFQIKVPDFSCCFPSVAERSSSPAAK